ncbi:MAG: fatty acid desaturase [Chloroflexota bacterium]|nr:fatty acid desaturase [Chloroflexota bacterium]
MATAGDSGYKPLADVRKSLRIEWYRSPIDRTVLKELSRRSDLQGWIQAGGHLALFALTGALTYFFWWQHIWIGFFVALFLHGTIGSFFVGTNPHELGHGSVFRTKWLNRWFNYVFCMLAWYDPFDYNVSHTFHHRYTLHPEGDREVLLPLKPTVGKFFLVQLFTVNVFTQPGRTLAKGGLLSTIIFTVRTAFGVHGPMKIPSHEWLKAIHADQPKEFRKSIVWARWQLVFHGAILVFAIATGQWVLPIILSLFPFIANWATYFVGLPMHCGLMDKTPDFRKCVRTITIPWPLEFIYWHMNWHLEHHMYAGVPCYNLSKLHKAIAHDVPEPRTLIGAWREMWYIWDRQQEDPSYQFDTPLPATAQRTREDEQDELDRSIADLAPDGLR